MQMNSNIIGLVQLIFYAYAPRLKCFQNRVVSIAIGRKRYASEGSTIRKLEVRIFFFNEG
jgi:hypothetical protein